MSEAETELESIASAFDALLKSSQRQYDRNINKDLSKHLSEDIFIRNVTSILKDAHESMLKMMDGATTVSDAIILRLQQFDEDFLAFALQKHRSSCALSNFPAEHNPDQAYIARTLVAIEQNKKQFAKPASD